MSPQLFTKHLARERDQAWAGCVASCVVGARESAAYEILKDAVS